MNMVTPTDANFGFTFSESWAVEIFFFRLRGRSNFLPHNLSCIGRGQCGWKNSASSPIPIKGNNPMLKRALFVM
jgi:hypothetical protein